MGNNSVRQGERQGDGALASPPAPRRLVVAEIMGGQREAILEHLGQDYRLRITASGKLILTK